MSEVRKVVFVDVTKGWCPVEVIALVLLIRLGHLAHPLHLHRSHYRSPPPMTHQFLECQARRQKMFEVFHMVLV